MRGCHGIVTGKEEFVDRITFSSPAIAKEMKRVYGSRAEEVKIEMRHEKEVKKYVMKIEEAHRRAADSELTFP